MQRAIWIVTFIIILAIGYYWIVVDNTRTVKMVELTASDKELSGDVNSTIEVYDRLELKWRGTCKHVETLQNETHAHYAAYAMQMDSIDVVFEEMDKGYVQLTVDQQPYYQGYMPVHNLFLMNEYGLGALDMNTGKALITPADVETIRQFKGMAVR